MGVEGIEEVGLDDDNSGLFELGDVFQRFGLAQPCDLVQFPQSGAQSDQFADVKRIDQGRRDRGSRVIFPPASENFRE